MANLLLRAGLGFLALMLVLALALFWAAGSLGFWQAWVYLAVFAVSVVLITTYLAARDPNLLAGRVNAGPVAETQKTQQVISSLASLLFIGLYVVSGLDFRYHWSDVPKAVVAMSDVLVALGFYVVFLVFRENTYTSGIIKVAEGQKVISTGPYRVVRHPMYSGAGLMLLFTAPALGSWVALPFAVAVILVVAVRAVEEEKYLEANLDGYGEYRRKVRYRLIPGVW